MTAHQSELMRQHEAHKARQAALWSGKRIVKPAPKGQDAVVIQFAKPRQKPLWMREKVSFREHIVAWQWHLAQLNASKPKAYLLQRCADFGIPYPVMIGPNRRRDIVGKRQLIMWEIQNQFGISYPAIGRLFGGRDHTTALHAFRKIDAMTPEERAQI